ncbi:RNA polymerase sigma factor [Kitasatospora sp. NPDC048365]|uniref:RNA polymerase sigma factor n=1 Tax=Kitasatospora sp. NPDC048365 TaxID=3364050 RepID=UPI00370FD589
MGDSVWPGEQVVVAAQQGDVDALAELVAASHPNVRRFALSLCASREDAEDAAQEAMIVLYRRIGMLRASGALASWMFRIVRNECLRRARTVLRDAPPRHREAGRVESSAEEEVLRRLEAGVVAEAIAALPADQRRVLVMRDVQGHSGRAVSDALGLSTAAMKSRLHRARAAVRVALGPAAEPSYAPPAGRAAAGRPAGGGR